MKKNKNDEEKEVTIKLKKWRIPFVLGAIKLGIFAEHWCACLAQSGIGTYDTFSDKWITVVDHIMDQIKEQTGVTAENKEYGDYENTVHEIDEWICKQCKTNQKAVSNIDQPPDGSVDPECAEQQTAK